MARNQVQTPRTMIVQSDKVDQIGPTLGFPCVLKQPDAAFSQGVVKVENEQELLAHVEEFFEKSELLIAQEFLPTLFDWRIGICDGVALYACKHHMARRHLQIVKNDHHRQLDYSN